MITRDDFTIEDGPVPEPGDGEFRVSVEYISLDPAMRGWVNEGQSYVPPVAIGEVMRGYAAGIVEASNHPDFKTRRRRATACSVCSSMRSPTASA